jgi:beta-glucosidase
MINSGDVNGIPGHANSYYINDILKGELKFDGFTVSDWEDIIRLYTRDRLAATPEDAVRIAVMAGLDMSMVPFGYSFHDHCVSLAKKNSDFSDRVNDAVRRILKVKKILGKILIVNFIFYLDQYTFINIFKVYLNHLIQIQVI